MEHPDYRANLEQVIAFTEGRQLLSIADVSRFTGLKKYPALHKRFPFIDGYISAATLARCLCGERSKK